MGSACPSAPSKPQAADMFYGGWMKVWALMCFLEAEILY